MNDDDTVFNTIVYQYDAFGQIVKQISYNDAGSDGIWFTADDDVGDYQTYTLSEDGTTEDRPRYGSGSDGKWFTDDDEIEEFYQYCF
ncbi:MAG: hypothetical protein JEZ04_16805 [Spirochaetales bacterium]|nr:hypothetical protein [Spirochaetales bacterium]